MKENKSLTDSSQIDSIIKEYSGDLRGYISHKVRFKEDVEDILQNVFYQLIKVDIDQAPILQLSSWLYTVAQNQITDYYRKKKEIPLPHYNEDESDTELVDSLINLLEEEPNTPEIQYLQSMIWVELEAALEELPKEQRLVFELNELEGFSFKEISESTGVPVNTLLSRKRYATLYLREKLRYLYDDLIS